MKSNSKAASPKEYIENLDEPRKSEIKKLDQLIQKTVKFKPFMLSGMLAYGPYHYKYASGREGDWCAIALASQKNYISLYACMAEGRHYVAENYKTKLPKASIGKSCVRFKKLADVDEKILVELLKDNMRVYKKLSAGQNKK